MAEQSMLEAITHIVASLASDQPPLPDTIKLPGGDSRVKKDLEVELRRLATLVNQPQGQPHTIISVDKDWQLITTSNKPCVINDDSFQTASEDVGTTRRNNVASDQGKPRGVITDTKCPCTTDSCKQHKAQSITAFAGLFNEMRTPLNSIAGLTEMTLDTELTERQREILVTVKTSAKSAITIVDDMMDYIKIERETMSVVSLPYSLRETVFETLQQLVGNALGKSASIKFYVDEPVPEKVLGDQYHVAQVIKTIIAAAGNHRSYGCALSLMITQHIEGNLKDPREDALEFVLSDAEECPDNDAMGPLTNQMQRVLNLETPCYTATDIAPFVSRRLVQIMGGKMWTTKGTRSQIHFTLPLIVAPSNPAHVLSQLRHYHHEGCVLLSQELAEGPLHIHQILRDLNLRPELMLYPLNSPEPTAQSLTALARRTVVIVVDSTATAKEFRSKKEFDAIPVVVVMADRVSITLTSAQHLDICACVPKSCDVEDVGSALLTAFKSTPIGLSRAFETKALDILIAEDNVVNQRLLKRMLDKFNHNVTIVPDGLQAVEAAQKKRYDVILMDISMPVMVSIQSTTSLEAVVVSLMMLTMS